MEDEDDISAMRARGTEEEEAGGDEEPGADEDLLGDVGDEALFDEDEELPED